MDKRVKSKLLALLGYSLSIIIIQRFFIPKLDEWRWVLFGVFLIILNLIHVITLLDIKIRIPISRRWYNILLTALTIGILILFLSFLR
jgi:hypothetical protein